MPSRSQVQRGVEKTRPLPFYPKRLGQYLLEPVRFEAVMNDSLTGNLAQPQQFYGSGTKIGNRLVYPCDHAGIQRDPLSVSEESGRRDLLTRFSRFLQPPMKISGYRTFVDLTNHTNHL